MRQLPFSQYCELRGTYDDDELALCLCVTGSEAELSRMEDEPSKILLSVTLLCQCISMRASEVTLTEDAYATRGEFSPEWSEVRLSCLLDRQTQTGTLRGSVPKQARAVIDSTLYLGEPTQQTQNGEATLTVPATVNILYMDPDGTLQSAIVRDQASRCNQALRTLTGGELAEGDKGAERFCVVVRHADKTQSLWDLAKQYRTSEAAIAGANGITSGEAEQGTLLLIPV